MGESWEDQILRLSSFSLFVLVDQALFKVQGTKRGNVGSLQCSGTVYAYAILTPVVFTFFGNRPGFSGQLRQSRGSLRAECLRKGSGIPAQPSNHSRSLESNNRLNSEPVIS